MATKPVVPFWDLDVSKLISDFKVSGIDVDALMAAQRKNIEAVTAANKVAFEGMQAVATRQTEILRQTMQEMSTVMSDLMQAGTPDERVAKQAELAKSAFERALSNMRGQITMTPRLPGLRDVWASMFTREARIRPYYHGTGSIYLRPPLGGYHLLTVAPGERWMIRLARIQASAYCSTV